MVTTYDIKYDNIDKVLPPVDMHDVRIAKRMGYVASDDMCEKNVQLVKELWNKALWLLGSVGCPTNKNDINRLLLL